MGYYNWKVSNVHPVDTAIRLRPDRISNNINIIINLRTASFHPGQECSVWGDANRNQLTHESNLCEMHGAVVVLVRMNRIIRIFLLVCLMKGYISRSPWFTWAWTWFYVVDEKSLGDVVFIILNIMMVVVCLICDHVWIIKTGWMDECTYVSLCMHICKNGQNANEAQNAWSRIYI